VDAANQETLAAVLQQLSDRGTALVVVTHEAAPLAEVIGRAVVVESGQVCYDGPLAGAGADGGGGHHHAGDPAPGRAQRYLLGQPRVTVGARRSRKGGR
jgi:zinc transport system ATP-binding protein